MKDSIRSGIIAGLLGTLGDALVHIFSYFILGTTTTSHYIAQLIFPFKQPTLYRLAFGEITHFSAGAFIGIVLVLIFKYFGSDYAYYKGLGLALMVWIVHVAIIPNIVQPRPYIVRTDLEVLVDLVAHIFYGVVATFYLSKIYKSNREFG